MKGKVHILAPFDGSSTLSMWTLCGLPPQMFRESANHWGPFGATCKTCIRVAKGRAQARKEPKP